MPLSFSQKVSGAFDKAADTYDSAADFQKFAAHRVALACPSFPHDSVDVLEIGAGTGFLTAYLQQRYPQGSLEVTDISENMLLKITEKFPPHPDFICRVMNGETLDPSPLRTGYDLIVSSLAIQWFEDPFQAFQRQKEKLKAGGSLVFSTLGEKSLREWKQALAQEGYVLNSPCVPFKEIESQEGISLERFEVIEDYGNGKAFLSHLKRIGASHVHGKTPCVDVVRRALRHFEGKITYDLIVGKIIKK